MEFAAMYPMEHKTWYETSNSVIVLSCKNERALWEFNQRLLSKGIKTAEFKEPDIGYELTAIAVCPGPDVKKLCSGIPLAGKKANEVAQDRLNRKFEIVSAMQACEQAPGQNMLEHGLSVRDHLVDLVRFMRDPHHTPKFQWRFPGWLLSHSQRLLAALPDDFTLDKYTTWHDCGKPFAKAVDDQGRVHFPDHAKKSAEVWRTISDDEGVARLIEQDMDIHTLSANGVEEFASRPEAVTLLLSGLAAVHSNAVMFGGVSSDSFKIKWKRMDQRGKAICKILFST